MDEPVDGAKAPSIISEPSSPQQRRIARVLIFYIVIAFGAVLVYGERPLPRSDGFLPAAQAIIFLFDVLTAVVLFGQFAVMRSRALLVLATGYLSSGLFVLAHTLTFPGAISPDGLFGASTKTAGWLYIVWHACFPAAVIAYAALRQKQDDDRNRLSNAPAAIRYGVIFAFVLVFGVTTLMIVADDRLPVFLVSERAFNELAPIVSIVNLILSCVALVMLQVRRKTWLDEWLSIAALAALAEATCVVFVSGRYTFGFYSIRIFAIIVSGTVLVALLSEIMRLYTRHAIALRRLQRERANKLMSLGLMVGSITHEIRQPLSVVSIRSGVVRRLVAEPDVDVPLVQACLAEVERAGDRVTETVDSLRALFRNAVEDHERIDVNELVTTATDIVEPIFEDCSIKVETEMTRELPHIVGHKRQLEEVLLNILQNAVDAMKTVTDRTRTLHLDTALVDDASVAITIEDSGIGIEPDRLPGIFDALITTKVDGTGLGLGICRMIIDQHSGELSVKSELGGGTRFRIVLPAEPAVTVPASESAAPRQSFRRKSIPNIFGSA